MKTYGRSSRKDVLMAERMTSLSIHILSDSLCYEILPGISSWGRQEGKSWRKGVTGRWTSFSSYHENKTQFPVYQCQGKRKSCSRAGGQPPPPGMCTGLGREGGESPSFLPAPPPMSCRPGEEAADASQGYRPVSPCAS